MDQVLETLQTNTLNEELLEQIIEHLEMIIELNVHIRELFIALVVGIATITVVIILYKFLKIFI